MKSTPLHKINVLEQAYISYNVNMTENENFNYATF